MKLRNYLSRPLAVACVALLCAAGARAQNARADANSAPFSPTPYRIGERLSYNVSFSNFMTAAHIETIVARRGLFQGRDGVELRAHVETLGVVSAALYSANNDYVSYVDPSTGQPYRFLQLVRNSQPGSALPSATVSAVGDEALASGQVLNSFPGTYDFLSAVFRMRALPLAQGDSYRMTIHGGATPYDIELRVTGRESIKTNLGTSNTIVTQVRVRNNDPVNNYRVRVYFTDDELHTPALVTARHPAGEIRVELAGVEILSEPPPAGVVAPTPRVRPSVAPSAGLMSVPPSPGGVASAPPTSGATPAAGGVSPTTPPESSDPLADLPFAPGEQLNFNFFAGTQPIGTASFQVRQRARYFNRDGLQFVAALQTTGAGQTLFPVSDLFNSYVDATTLLPFRTEARVQEGRRRAGWVVSVDQERGNALFDDGSRVEMPAGTHDLVSVFYALRSFDLTPGKENRVALLINKRPRLLSVAALRSETIQLGTRQIPAVVLSLVTSDPEGDRFQLRLWVSTDRRRLPLRLTAVTPLGPVRADLAIIPLTLQ